jgi:hypothetical protein
MLYSCVTGSETTTVDTALRLLECGTFGGKRIDRAITGKVRALPSVLI